MKALFHERIYFTSCEAVNSESVLLEVIASSLNLSLGSKDMLNNITRSIREASKPVLLTLDNFETCWFSDRRYEIHQVLKHLAALNNLILLVTMRGNEEPPEIRWERLSELGVLSTDDASKLFMDITEKETLPDHLVDELFQALDCLPLAITLLAQLARQGETIQTLHRRWSVQKTGLLSTGNERHYNLDASIKLSLESAPMKEDLCTARLLRVLSYLPDGISSGSLESLGLFSVKEVY
jgi:hypothetical protein